MLNILGMIALAAFFFAVSWFFIRVAASTTEKKVYLAACICCAGSVSVALSFLLSNVFLPDQNGCTHEPVWINAISPGGFIALGIGYCVQAWQTRSFFPVVAGMILTYTGNLSVVQAALPSVLNHVPYWIGLVVLINFMPTWKESNANLRYFFGKPMSAKFKE